MATQMPNVRTWSRSVPSHRFSVRDLDAYVLKEHDELLAAMGMARARVWARGDLPDVPPIALTVIAPLVGAMGWSGRPTRGAPALGDRADGLAAVCFMAALVGLVLIAQRWYRSRRRWSSLDVAGVATTGAAGILALALMRNASGIAVLEFPPITLPVWAATVLAAVVGAAMALVSQGKRVPFRRHFRRVRPADRQRVAELVGALESRRREKLMEERRRAVARLRERALIDEELGRRIRSLPLGLSVTMDP